MDLVKIEEFCKKAHIGQRRKGGLPYFTHPVAVRDLLMEYGITDSKILAAALLHDVLEDTHYTATDILSVADEAVVYIVEELTRRDNATATWQEKAEALNKKARNFSREATYIKLADRIHNLRTAAHEFTPERIIQYAKATLSLVNHMPKADEYALAFQMKRDLIKLCHECITTFSKNST